MYAIMTCWQLGGKYSCITVLTRGWEQYYCTIRPLSILNGKLYIAQPQAYLAWLVNMVIRLV